METLVNLGVMVLFSRITCEIELLTNCLDISSRIVIGVPVLREVSFP
jgi:hypothetical protein